MSGNERGIRVPLELRDRIKLAAAANKMSMVKYLDSIVPDLKVERKVV